MRHFITPVHFDLLLQVRIVDNAQNDIRVVGTIALIVMQSIIIIGTEWESKVSVINLKLAGRNWKCNIVIATTGANCATHHPVGGHR